MSQCHVDSNTTQEEIPSLKEMWSRIISITWPAFFENILTGMFNMVDLMMLGWVTPVYIAAVGLTNQPFFLYNAAFFGVNIGATALVAWSVGGQRLDRARSITGQVIALNTMIGVILFLLSFFSADAVVQFMGSNAETHFYARTYLQIRSVGLLFTAMSMAVSASLRGAGETKAPMLYNLIANFLNVFFNYILIFGKLGFPAMGVAGAAIATVFSQFIGLVLALMFVFRSSKTLLRIAPKDCFRIERETAKQVFKIGLPSCLEQVIMQSGFMLFARTVAALGTTAFAAHQIGLNVSNIVFTPAQAFGVAATTLTGQRLGAQKPQTAKKYIRYVQQLAVAIGLFTGTVLIVFAKQLSGFYTSDPEVIALTSSVLIFLAIAQPGQTTQLSITGALRGAGDTVFPMLSVFTSVWGMRVVLAYFLVHVWGLGLKGAWISIMLDQYTRAVIVYARYYSGKWMYARQRHLAKKGEPISA